MTDSVESTGTADLGEQLVLNGLRDIITAESIVLADDVTRDRLRDAYETVTAPDERDRFADAVSAAEGGGEADGIASVVGATVDELDARGITAVVDHRTAVSLDDRNVALYNLLGSGEESDLRSIGRPARIQNPLVDGLERLSHDDEGAREAFERAIDAADTPDGRFVPGVLAAWTMHRLGRDEEAGDYAEAILDQDGERWAALMVAAAAGAESPQLFRDGIHSVGAYLRIRADVPEAANLEAAIGLGDEDEEADAWQELPGSAEFFDIDELGTTTRLRVRLEGAIRGLPSIHAYYFALGVIDRENRVPRSVEHLFLTGPETANTSERFRLERA